MRRAFIVAQVALAFVLLTGASLLGISLRRAMAVAPGFRPDHVITGQFNLTWNGYPELSTFHKFFDRLFEKTRRAGRDLGRRRDHGHPGRGPRPGRRHDRAGATRRPAGKRASSCTTSMGVAGDYFSAMGIPLVSGRFLEPADATRETWTCVVDERSPGTTGPTETRSAKEIYTGHAPPPDAKYYTVVGVVGTGEAGRAHGEGRPGNRVHSLQPGLFPPVLPRGADKPRPRGGRELAREGGARGRPRCDT